MDFLDGGQRKDRGPPQAVVSLSPDLAHPAVVGAAQRHVQVHVIGEVDAPQGRVDHFRGRAALVQVPHPGRRVGQLPHPQVDVLPLPLPVLLGRGAEPGTALAHGFGEDLPVDEPEGVGALILGVAGRLQQDRPAVVHVLVHELPYLRRFDDVRIRIDEAVHVVSFRGIHGMTPCSSQPRAASFDFAPLRLSELVEGLRTNGFVASFSPFVLSPSTSSGQA